MCAELLAFPAPSIPVPGRIARNPHMRACGIYGPCMTPLINPEDKVIVDTSIRNPKPGQITAFRSGPHGQAFIKFATEDPSLWKDNHDVTYRFPRVSVIGVVVYVVKSCEPR